MYKTTKTEIKYTYLRKKRNSSRNKIPSFISFYTKKKIHQQIKDLFYFNLFYEETCKFTKKRPEKEIPQKTEYLFNLFTFLFSLFIYIFFVLFH